MAGQRQVNPEGSVFLAELRAFREQCGSPSYRRLVTLSRDLSTLYNDRDLPPLSVSAISEILAGRRVELPGSAWVSSFVLCCQRHAWNIGILAEADDPGLVILPAWQEKLQAARTAAEASEPGDVSCDPGRTPLAEAEYTYVASQGPYGQALLAGLETGDPEAAYRVAVVLAPVLEHRDAAIALLVQPGTARHLLALDLLEAEAGRFEEAVADHACALAGAATDDGSVEKAIVFYEAAALCRSRTALVALAALLLAERGRQRSAARIRAANATGIVRPVTPHGPDGFPASN